MSDQVAARREARRRKILENSENRLKQITGGAESRAPGNFSECEIEVDGLENGTKTEQSSCINQENDEISRFSYSSMRSSLPYDYSKSTEDISHPVSEEGLHCDKHERFSHQADSSLYISMAGLFRIFIEFNGGGICPHNLIVAFLMIKCGSVLLYGVQPAETSPLIQGLFILSGVSPQKLRFIIFSFSFLSAVIEHFALFTFTFVLLDIFINICLNPYIHIF